jgi:hypothetical protein
MGQKKIYKPEYFALLVAVYPRRSISHISCFFGDKPQQRQNRTPNGGMILQTQSQQ